MFYQTQHPFYCGVDLHTKTLHVCIVDQAGTVLVHRNLPASPELFLQTLAPYRDQASRLPYPPPSPRKL